MSVVNVIIEYIGLILILGGALSAFLGAIGHIRFPDVYNRAHAATKSSTIAVLITLTGAMIFIVATQGELNIRLLLGIVFVYLTNPVSSHLLLRASYRTKVKLADITIEDDLKEVVHGDKDELNENQTNKSSN